MFKTTLLSSRQFRGDKVVEQHGAHAGVDNARDVFGRAWNWPKDGCFTVRERRESKTGGGAESGTTKFKPLRREGTFRSRIAAQGG